MKGVDFDELFRLLAAFEREEVEYAVFGAAALNLHGIVRGTEDGDLFLRPTPENLDRFMRALRSVYDDPNIDQINCKELLDDYPSVRYFPPETEFYYDFLTRLGDFARWENLEIEEKELRGVRVKLVSPRTLHWMKKGTVRHKDRIDTLWLEEKFGPME